MNDKLIIAGKEFHSRLLIGTGKFSSSILMKQAIESSGAEIITVALRRVDLKDTKDSILSFIDKEKYLILPNTSGACNADEAVRIARLAKSAGISSWIKLEITPEPRYLLPDPIETLKAAEILVKQGFTVLPYINADPMLAKRLEEIGVAAVMPLGSLIGSNQGFKTKDLVKIIIENSKVPVIVDAGLGLASHVASVMEYGADAVLVNTAIAIADDPVNMAYAFKLGVEAGRIGFLSGQARVFNQASASSPRTGFLK